MSRAVRGFVEVERSNLGSKSIIVTVQKPGIFMSLIRATKLIAIRPLLIVYAQGLQ